jgi:DNA-binding MarR family transcriptional regulator
MVVTATARNRHEFKQQATRTGWRPLLKRHSRRSNQMMLGSLQMKKPLDVNGGLSFEAFDLEDFLPYRLSVAAENVSRLIIRDHLADSGLTMAEWRLVAAVGRFGVISPTAAGAYAAMDKVKVSRAAASLVAQGLLRQTQDPEDGRGRLLRLTRKGSAVYAAVVPTAGAIEATLMESLTRTERSVLHKALAKLSAQATAILEPDEIEEEG